MTDRFACLVMVHPIRGSDFPNCLMVCDQPILRLERGKTDVPCWRLPVQRVGEEPQVSAASDLARRRLRRALRRPAVVSAFTHRPFRFPGRADRSRHAFHVRTYRCAAQVIRGALGRRTHHVYDYVCGLER